MSSLTPFTAGGTTVSISVSGSSQNIAVQSTATPTPGCAQIRVFNSGSAITFIAFGGSTVTATTSSLPIAPNSVEVFTMPLTGIYAAAIGTSGNTIYFTPGDGT
jgi:hypothetical protein